MIQIKQSSMNVTPEKDGEVREISIMKETKELHTQI